eukprot:952018-Lingulodinium_polyedra.AAC.1
MNALAGWLRPTTPAGHAVGGRAPGDACASRSSARDRRTHKSTTQREPSQTVPCSGNSAKRVLNA